jgi:hypothetical protein
MKYHILAVVKVVVFAYVMPLVVGLVAGLFKKEQARARSWWIAGVLIGLVNVVVMIEKHGVPFITGHVFNMFAATPYTLNQQLFVGLLGDAALFLIFRWALGAGIGVGIHLASRPAKT